MSHVRVLVTPPEAQRVHTHVDPLLEASFRSGDLLSAFFSTTTPALRSARAFTPSPVCCQLHTLLNLCHNLLFCTFCRQPSHPESSAPDPACNRCTPSFSPPARSLLRLLPTLLSTVPRTHFRKRPPVTAPLLFLAPLHVRVCSFLPARVALLSPSPLLARVRLPAHPSDTTVEIGQRTVVAIIQSNHFRQ